jgi:hypothetical protein
MTMVTTIDSDAKFASSCAHVSRAENLTLQEVLEVPTIQNINLQIKEHHSERHSALPNNKNDELDDLNGKESSQVGHAPGPDSRTG